MVRLADFPRHPRTAGRRVSCTGRGPLTSGFAFGRVSGAPASARTIKTCALSLDFLLS